MRSLEKENSPARDVCVCALPHAILWTQGGNTRKQPFLRGEPRSPPSSPSALLGPVPSLARSRAVCPRRLAQRQRGPRPLPIRIYTRHAPLRHIQRSGHWHARIPSPRRILRCTHRATAIAITHIRSAGHDCFAWRSRRPEAVQSTGGIALQRRRRLVSSLSRALATGCCAAALLRLVDAQRRRRCRSSQYICGDRPFTYEAAIYLGGAPPCPAVEPCVVAPQTRRRPLTPEC